MWYFEIVDFVDLVDFVDFLKTSEKEFEKTFIFLIQSILFSNVGLLQRERENKLYFMRNFNNNFNNINLE